MWQGLCPGEKLRVYVDYVCAAARLFQRSDLGRKNRPQKVLAVYFFGTALAAWFFGHAATTSQVLSGGSLLYFFSLGAWGCVYAYTPEVYLTALRGTGSGWASAFGRVGAFLAPFVVPVVHRFYGDKGYTYVFILLAAVFVFVSVIVGIFGKETMGKSFGRNQSISLRHNMAKTKGTEGLISVKTKQDRNFSLFEIKSLYHNCLI